MRLKFPENSFLVVGEREKKNSEFTSFVVVSVVELENTRLRDVGVRFNFIS